MLSILRALPVLRFQRRRRSLALRALPRHSRPLPRPRPRGALAGCAGGRRGSERRWSDPRFLTRLVRPTRDIDFAVFDESRPRVLKALGELGFKREGALHRRIPVDAVQAISVGEELETLLALLADEVEESRRSDGLRVMSSAGLVVLKAVAAAVHQEDL